MTGQRPWVSIIILHYGFADVTRECLDQVLAQTHSELEVFLVENGHPDPLPEDFFSDQRCRRIRSYVNLGYAGGNNLAIREAKGDFVVVINNDVILPPDWVASMLDRWPGSDWGLMSSVIVQVDHGSRIQYAGFTPVSPWTGRNRIVGVGDPWKPDMRVKDTSYAHGSAMMISRSALEAAGGIPEQYFLHYEELDWSEQVRRSGFRVGVNHATSAKHYGSLTLGRDSLDRWYYYHRGRLIFQRRWLRWWQKPVFFLYYFLIASPKEILTHAAQCKWGHLRAWMEAVGWHIRHVGGLPERSGKRRQKKEAAPLGQPQQP